MLRIWCERALPAQYHYLLEDAKAIWRETPDSDGLLPSMAGADAVIASARVRYDGQLMDQIPTLKVISRTGIGIDNIAVDDATARGIAVCNAPDAPSISTAEYAITLMLSIMKQVQWGVAVLHSPEQRDYFNEYTGLDANGRCLGLVGVGRIGSRVAQVALALDMSVMGYDPFISQEQADEIGVERTSTLEDLLQRADVVSLHVPVTPETLHLMNAQRLAQMKRGAFLINTARGKLVDEDALLDALNSGHLQGAALDVFENEPPKPDRPLLQRDDVIVSPHIAGATVDSKDRLWRAAIHQALQVLRGERPAHLVNPEVWSCLRGT